MIATCESCGAQPQINFPTDNEMQSILREAGWLCINFDGQWSLTCPACRKEKRREKAMESGAADRSAHNNLLDDPTLGDARAGGR